MLLKFLKNVVDNETNKMTIKNVSMVMAPNLFPMNSKLTNEKELGSKEQANMELVMMAGQVSHIVRLMVNYQQLLWIVSSSWHH